jgi:hypothetical protein
MASHMESIDELFRSYRDACPTPEPGPDFMPAMWARIEARETSANWLGRFAKGLVTAALATSVILGMTLSSLNRSSGFFDATFVDALRADQMAALEPLHIDRISELETTSGH